MLLATFIEMFLKNLISTNKYQKLTYCTKKSSKTKSYSNTIFLPKTGFPLRVDSSKLKQHDEHITNTAGFSQLYNWQGSHLSEPEFVLHDGPPYANGKLHMGHAINKILKDTILRYEILKGNKIHYVPGWDCHGLPIEMRALSACNAFNMDPLEIRAKARNLAKSTIEEQKKVFQSWGISGDWSNSYETYTPNYYKVQFKLFHKLLKKKLIYRDVKPVYWSPSSRSALAEAELEYNPSFKSPSVYVRFEVKKMPSNIPRDGENKVYALIWTTTPWTLPSNQGVCFNPTITYCLAKNSSDGNLYIFAKDLTDSVSKVLQCDFSILQSFSGTVLSNFTYNHPVYGNRELKFIPASHVTMTKGTGLVHTAPAHGPEDFVVALENKMSISNLVDELGCYTAEAGSDLEGKFVLREGTETVLKMIKKNIVHLGELIHSYPCDWRTKQPVIIRASNQWFIDTNALKAKALTAIENVKIVPKLHSDVYKSNLINQIQKRPYWCISRQRKWGVPIPVLFNKTSGQPVINDDILAHLCQLLDNHGTDFWWKLPVDQLIPSDLKTSFDINELEKSQDILDIWFDSGISWAYALEGNKVADMYLEGIDQFNGWFQASLLTSVALREKAPYKKLYVHGFAVDEKGMKMSKSLGNVIDPLEIISGAKGKKAYGINTLRWWVACHANKDSVAYVSDNILQSSADEVQKIRSVLRFALGSLEDYNITSLVPYEKFSILDKHMLHLLHEFDEHVQQAIKDHQFHHISSAVINLLTNPVSALYYTGIKDKLYCEFTDSTSRRTVQFVLLQIFETVTQAIAPIVPHLVEEMHQHLPVKSGKTYFTSVHCRPDKVWKNPEVAHLMAGILNIKKNIHKVAGASTNNLVLNIGLSQKLWDMLQKHKSASQIENELEDILQVSQVTVSKSSALTNEDFTLDISNSKRFLCVRCRRVQSDRKNDLCTRCHQVVDSFNNDNDTKIEITN